jgi:hypothetical protein
MSELSKQHQDLTAQIKKGLTLDEASGIINPADGLYASLLPEGLTMEMAERFQAHNTDVLAATAHAVGEIAIPAMENNSELNKVTFELPTVGKDTFNFTFDRSRQVRDGAPGDKEAGMKTKWGLSQVSVDTYAAGNRGSLALVKSLLSDQATAALGSKK